MAPSLRHLRRLFLQRIDGLIDPSEPAYQDLMRTINNLIRVAEGVTLGRLVMLRFVKVPVPLQAEMEAEVRARLAADPKAASGYRWSGGPGPPVKLSSGTTVHASVTIERRAPISLLLPLLKRQAGLAS